MFQDFSFREGAETPGCPEAAEALIPKKTIPEQAGGALAAWAGGGVPAHGRNDFRAPSHPNQDSLCTTGSGDVRLPALLTS